MARTARIARMYGDPDAESDGHTDGPELDDEAVQKLKQLEEGSMLAELKHIDRKWTEKGQTYFAETIHEEIPEQTNWWTQFALCLVRHMDRANRSCHHVTLQINSQHLKDILRDVIGSFPGISFETKEITIAEPYRVLYHYHKELKEAGNSLEPESDAAKHLEVLLRFIEEQFKDTVAESDNLREKGLMSYQHLWTIFRPGTVIYAPVNGQPRAFTLLNYQYICGMCPGLQLSVSYIDFDGEQFGTREMSKTIGQYVGAERITDLAAFPLEFHASPEEVKKVLIARGMKWERHAGMHFCCYSGIGYEQGMCGPVKYSVSERVMVDAKTFHRLNPNQAFTVSPLKSPGETTIERPREISEDDEDYDLNEDEDEEVKMVSTGGLGVPELTDEQRVLASSMVRGFSFSEKRWLDFFIDKIGPVDWNPHCFDQLVLPDAQKDLVRALVATHTQQKNGFDDIVKGKGKGLILVLHGPPGVGKTLTAECVAEYSKRPLYVISSGDLGTNASTLDDRLSRILDMASTWKAVLLIDEADVFLERRSLHDMERNSLVSIFLRVLEYYEGILFLTSNRVNTFDDAFKSRIHVPLKYDPLPVSSRKKIWKNFLENKEDGAEIGEEGYNALALADLNGRQIKNVIRTAKSLAQFHNQKLDRGKLEQVVGIQMDFERELNAMNAVKAETHED